MGVVLMFTAFALAAQLGTFLEARKTPLAAAAVGVPLAAILFGLLVLALPFHGLLTELPIAPAAALLWCWPMMGITVLNRSSQAQKSTPTAAAALAVCWLPLGGLVGITCLERENYADRLQWACDGKIEQVTRAEHNHMVRTLVVNAQAGEVRFEKVDDDLWKSAHPGQRLVKKPGSAFAELDGARVRLVPQSLHWWNDPDR